MAAAISVVLFVAAGLALASKAAQALALAHFRQPRPRPVPERWPGISVLKPLCGIDDSLEDNLAVFGELPYPVCEVLLGVKDTRDPAYPLAVAAAELWPERIRVVVQQGAPGLNPKVNQLITLARAAQHEILVVSDSNVRVTDRYLPEIAALFEDPGIGLVTHAVAGEGEECLGALMDNLLMTAHVSAGLVSAKLIAGKDIVVGKSMAFRRTDLAAMGGFESAKDVLAEDYTMGVRVTSELGKRVALAREPITNVTQHRTVAQCVHRYERWAVLQRRVVSLGAYLAQALLYPVALAIVGFAVAPGRGPLVALAGIALMRVMIDAIACAQLRTEIPWMYLVFVPLFDLLAAKAWLHGLMTNCVEWPGNQLRVVEGTRLVPPDAEGFEELDEASTIDV